MLLFLPLLYYIWLILDTPIYEIFCAIIMLHLAGDLIYGPDIY